MVIKLVVVLTLIMPPCTPLVARKLSLTASFSAYGASAVTRLILKKRAKKWLFFSDTVATQNGLLVKPAIELWPSPVQLLISEPDETPAEQPGTIPLVLTYHPTNVQVKNIITRNLHLIRDDPETATIFQPLRILCAYRCDSNLCDSLVRSTLENTTVTNEARGTFPCSRTQCNTCAHTNTSASIATPGGHITAQSKYTCLGKNVVYAVKCHTCNKLYIGETGRRLGDCFREHLCSTRLSGTDLPVGHHFTSPSHSIGDMLVSVTRSGFRSPTESRSFEARMIFRHWP